ncbi:uncharacterized protein LOC660880 [Tribolium castaneum]|uniref:Uncharacterized protein n=1 Tax=Tribolium castaneum TaxID=7070 RepID=D2A4Q7_TRICA|nr:PREDICTED: uncharacterized protein LOC660880 [Tribolium castaneum]EFA05254.1 hypothetical protein TcasGA2_TC015406 [Tribolium castaneum]|eukprot:XP_976363.1 PREDICTED: uncharacterized protein LOC660880 [Tribolium castaneum]
MPQATLLLREETSSSLSTLVEKSQHRKPPLPSYDLALTPTHFSLTPLPRPETDEGFESDTLSLVSSDGSYETKTTETDSANGSSTSDSDTETPEATRAQHHNLVDCVCYTDVKVPDVLIFIIKSETLVFKFDNLDALTRFYSNFTAVKAVANQKAYSKSGAKFNLLERTDNNGVTHIEITPLRKVWSSADDLLSPRRPERRKKGRAPPPPPTTSDVLRGEYVRVNVSTAKDRDFIVKSQHNEKKPPVKLALFRPVKTDSLMKQRSRSETRCFTPMAYRYIDTAPAYSPMGNRLFGLSSKLRDFGEPIKECRWNNMAELGYTKEGNLKSVIKKEESKKKNEKKVTFSAYTTVQVV